MKEFTDPSEKPSTAEEFWLWFASESANLKAMDPAKMMQLLGFQVADFAKDVIFGVFTAEIDEVWTLEISAGGVEATISQVFSLTESAPNIPGWEFVAFKQAGGLNSIKFNGIDLDFSAIRAVLVRSDGPRQNVILYMPIPEDTPIEKCQELGFIALDHTIGEYNVMTKIGQIWYENIANAHEFSFPLTDLPNLWADDNLD